MRRQFRGRSDAFVRSNDGEQGFWPSYADMMAAVALILFFVMLLSYIQNLITGNKLENTKAALADAEEKLTATQTLLEETELELQTTQSELETTKNQLAATRTELLNTQSSLNETLQQVASAQAELSQVSGELKQANQTLAAQRKTLAEQNEKISSQNEMISSQNTKIATQDASLAAAYAELENMRNQMNALAVLRLSIVEQIRDSMAAAIRDPSKVSVGESGNLILSASILFESGKYDITPEAEPALDLLIDVFYRFLSDENNRNYVESIIISGHTDSVGSDESNRELSTNRANAVLNYLLAGRNGELNRYAEYFCAAGYGEKRQVVITGDDVSEAANRRIEISITLKDDSIMALVESLAGN
ncbi:MAG: OmpA family protein [Oscillospiraceae bacterium]|nr:OmpA family protein [Oscillospiraceae bacterium]